MHPLAGQITKHERLLHARALDRPGADAVECYLLLIENGSQDFALFAGRFQSLCNPRPVIGIKARDQIEITVSVDDIFDVRSGLGLVGAIFFLGDDLYVMTLDRVLDAPRRWAALSAESVPTNTAIFPPLGKSFTI